MARSLIDQLISLSKTQQFYWFVGHLLSVVLFTIESIKSFFSSSLLLYKYTLICIIFTYTIVIKQIHFKSKTTIKNISIPSLIKDENIQYFALSIWFYVSSFIIGKISGCLISFNIYLIFHVLNYFQHNLLQYTPLSLPAQNQVNSFINQFQVRFNQSALNLASSSEIFIIVHLVLSLVFSLIRVWSNFTKIIWIGLTLVIMLGFIKLRFHSNTFTNQILKNYDLKITHLLSSNPQFASILSYYVNIKSLVISKLSPLDRLTTTTTKKQ